MLNYCSGLFGSLSLLHVLFHFVFAVMIIVELTAMHQSVFAAFPVLRPKVIVLALQNSGLQAEFQVVIEFQQFCLSG